MLLEARRTAQLPSFSVYGAKRVEPNWPRSAVSAGSGDQLLGIASSLRGDSMRLDEKRRELDRSLEGS